MNRIFKNLRDIVACLAVATVSFVACNKSGGERSSTGGGTGGGGNPTDTTVVVVPPVKRNFWKDEADNITINQKTGEVTVTGANPKVLQLGTGGSGSNEWQVKLNGTASTEVLTADQVTRVRPANLKPAGAAFDRTKAYILAINKATLDTLGINLTNTTGAASRGVIKLIGETQDPSAVENKATGTKIGNSFPTSPTVF